MGLVLEGFRERVINHRTTLTPGFVYQTTMDKSVNTSDEWWFFVTLALLCN